MCLAAHVRTYRANRASSTSPWYLVRVAVHNMKIPQRHRANAGQPLVARHCHADAGGQSSGYAGPVGQEHSICVGLCVPSPRRGYGSCLCSGATALSSARSLAFVVHRGRQPPTSHPPTVTARLVAWCSCRGAFVRPRRSRAGGVGRPGSRGVTHITVGAGALWCMVCSRMRARLQPVMTRESNRRDGSG